MRESVQPTHFIFENPLELVKIECCVKKWTILLSGKMLMSLFKLGEHEFDNHL